MCNHYRNDVRKLGLKREMSCEPNETVGAIHPKAMPVILPDRDAWTGWLTTETPIAMQQPLDYAQIRRIEPDWKAA